MSPRGAVTTGALLGAITVGLGAFGAHALGDRVPAGDLAIWETAVHYQGLHALALILFGLFAQGSARPRMATAWCFLLGVLVFSGTLYGIVLGGPRALGAITPVGGSLLIAGWALFAFSASRRP